MWKQLIEKIFGKEPFVGLKELLHQLERFAAPMVSKQLTNEAYDLLIEGVDAVITAAVNTLHQDSASELVNGYVEELEHDLGLVIEAIVTYVPLQLAVETEIKEFGVKSPQAKSAIEKRNAEVGQIHTDLGVLIGHMMHFD